MKKYLLLTLCFVFYGSQFAQTAEKTVLLTVSGQGSSLDNARQSALRTAIEQAFGTFISAKTEILNDEMVSDQITSVSSGNIQSFEILNEAELPNGNWAVTLKALVSVDKLTSFVQSRGVEVLIKGGLFSLNIKQQLLNEQGEINAMCELIGVLHEPMQTAFDYTINNGEPQSVDDVSKNWKIPIEVMTVANGNLDICMDYLQKTLSSIAMTPSEVESYEKLNKKTFPVVVVSDGAKKNIYFRKAKSIEVLLGFINNWEFYTTLFEVNDGSKISNYYNTELNFNTNTEFSYPRNGEFSWFRSFGASGEAVYNVRPYHPKKVRDNTERLRYLPNIHIYLYHAKDTVARFVWNDVQSLEQLNMLEKYTIHSMGIRSKFKLGGYVVYEENGHGLVASICDVNSDSISSIYPFNHGPKSTFLNMDSFCATHFLNGYSDWVAPSFDDMKLVYQNIFSQNISIFEYRNPYYIKDNFSSNFIFPYLTKSDTGFIFLNSEFQRNSSMLLDVMFGIRGQVSGSDRVGTDGGDSIESNIVRSITHNNIAVLRRVRKDYRGRIRPVRKF